jgi:hypothetical protein
MQYSIPGLIVTLACLVGGIVLVLAGYNDPGILLLGAAIGTLGPSPVSRA